MTRPIRNKETLTAKRAEPIRRLLQTLVRNRIKTKADKTALAEFLAQSVAGIEAMIYHGEGGLDSWVSALMYCYRLDPKTINTFFSEHKAELRKLSRVSKSDQLWFELDDSLTEDEKFYWASLIKTSIDLQKSLLKNKK